MKKLILLFSILFVSTGLFAQGDFGLSTNSTYRGYDGVSTDTLTGVRSLAKTCKVNKDFLYFYTITMDVDTVGASTAATSCILSGSNDNVNFTTITDQTFQGTVDTVWNYTDVSTGVLWRFLKVTMTGDGATSGVELQKFNVKVGKAEL